MKELAKDFGLDSLPLGFESVKERYRRYELVVEGVNDGYWVYDLKRETYSMTPKDQKITGLYDGVEELSVKHWEALIHPEDLPLAQAVLAQFLDSAENFYESSYRVRAKDGSYRWIHSKGIIRRDKEGIAYELAGTHTDATAIVEQEKRLSKLAFFDSLTKLPNRLKLQQDWPMLSLSPDALFLFIDVDDVSYINSLIGYEYGDHLLWEIGGLLMERYCTEYVARIDSDQFGVVIKSCPNVQEELEDLLSVLRKKTFLDERSVRLTFSIGVSGITARQGLLAVLRKANTALHCSKQNGKDQYTIYEESMENYAYACLDILRQLRVGLEQGEFCMYYQPIMDAKSSALAGVEALVRWRRPHGGFIPPAEFIPIAERTTQMMDVEAWVLDAVFRQCRKWMENGRFPGFVSINLSAKGLIRQGLIPYLSDLVSTYGVDPGCVELEITETAVLQTESNTLETLAGLKQLGFRLSLDDFGTGYSSLNYLKALPLDKVKLDRSFISSIEESSKDRLIVVSTIELAHRIQLEVVAEGVETKAQAEMLSRLNCDYLQGYYFGRPCPPE